MNESVLLAPLSASGMSSRYKTSMPLAVRWLCFISVGVTRPCIPCQKGVTHLHRINNLSTTRPQVRGGASRTCTVCVMYFGVSSTLVKFVLGVHAAFRSAWHAALQHSLRDADGCVLVHPARQRNRPLIVKGGTYRCFRFTKVVNAPDGIEPMVLLERALQCTRQCQCTTC